MNEKGKNYNKTFILTSNYNYMYYLFSACLAECAVLAMNCFCCCVRFCDCPNVDTYWECTGISSPSSSSSSES